MRFALLRQGSSVSDLPRRGRDQAEEMGAAGGSALAVRQRALTAADRTCVRRFWTRALKMTWPVLYVLVLVGACATFEFSAGAFGASLPASPPRCFGAASRDPLHPCHNPGLTHLLVPSPIEAVLTPNALCTPIEPALNVCGFGAPPAPSHPVVALVGNSHANHWRASMAVVDAALGWQGISITMSGCPFSSAAVQDVRPTSAGCASWHQAAIEWFWTHPEVETMFSVDKAEPVVVPHGTREIAVAAAGYIATWAALPPSVRHIVVIRDNPVNYALVIACVERAVAKHRDAGRRCAEQRRFALKPDPAVIAAQELHSPRVQVIDMTHYFCGRRLCFPVIGGVLVYRDSSHLTLVYANTLGPYLLRAVRTLVTPWNPA